MSELMGVIGDMIPVVTAVLTGVAGVLTPIYRWGARMSTRLDRIEVIVNGAGGVDALPARVRGIESTLAGINATLERIEIGLNDAIQRVEGDLVEHMNRSQDEAHFMRIIRKK